MTTFFSTDEQLVNQLFGSDTKYVIPEFQRPYSWNSIGKSDSDNQVNVMWDDLINYFQTTNPNPYFLGSMVLIPEQTEINTGRVYRVIDGQQRLTTLTILFVAIRCFLQDFQNDNQYKELIESITDRIDSLVYNKIWDNELRREKKVKIETSTGFNYDNVLKIITECGDRSKISNEETEEQKDVVDRYFKNLLFFESELKKTFLINKYLTVETSRRLSKFVGFLTNGVIVVRILASQADVAYQIFEVLNNRGLPLSNKDLFRNFLIKEYVAQTRNHTTANLKWFELENNYELDISFIARWVESKLARKHQFWAYSDLTGIYKEYQPTSTKSKLECFFDDFKTDLSNYTKFTRNKIDNKTINRRILFLMNSPNNYSIINLLLALFRNTSDNAKLEEFLLSFERFTIYTSLEPTIRFSSEPIFEAIKYLNNNDFKNAIQKFELQNGQLEKLKELISSSIKDNDFAKLLICKCIWNYNTEFDDGIIEYELEYKSATLEHIIPQIPERNSNWLNNFSENFRNDFTYKLGNMTLLTGKGNSIAKNKDIEWKAEKVYTKTKLSITRELVLTEIINESFFIERHNILVELICKDLQLEFNTNAIIQKEEKTSKIIPTISTINTDFIPTRGNLEKVEVLDKVNYFGLIKGEQIMFCSSRKQSPPLVLWCLEKQPKHGLSNEGYEYFHKNHFNGISNFVAQVEYIQLQSSKLQMWEELYKEKLFPFWDPQFGPFEFNREKLNRIVLCRVYKTDLEINQQDIKPAPYNKKTLANYNKMLPINDILKASAPILSIEKYEELENKIKSILKRYNAANIR